ncbi:MAG: phage holin family protein [Anaerolineaceae bacterium]|nr:phage holin family protein [Anaerolineaceae bacterium]
MQKFLIRLAINAVALYAALTIMEGNGVTLVNNTWLNIFILAIIFGVINATLKPLMMVLGCPFLILTLGLGTLLINTALFALAGWIGNLFQVGFTVSGFWPAFLGALIVSVVSFLLGLVFKPEKNRSK